VHALKSSANPDANDDDTVIGQQHIVGIKHEMVDVFARGSGERTGYLTDHEAGIVGRERGDVQLFTQRGPRQPAGDDEDASLILGSVDHSKHAGVLDTRGLLRCLSHFIGVRVAGVE
jgi:hypothetical protein